MKNASTEAMRAHAAIVRIVDDYYSDKIDHSTFTARMRGAWDNIAAAGLTADVCALIRATEETR